MNTNDIYMQRCLQLATNALGNTYPNPLVGCVIVHNNRIIGEGYHQKCGGPHAEVNAINSISDDDKNLLSESTVYVNLEPCAHYGKTPPCADLLIENKVQKVVVAGVDPFDKVAGLGIAKLKKAGIDVELGVMQKEAKFLNRRFIKYYTRKQPYIILKWAESIDGFIDINRDNKQIGSYTLSNKQTQLINHVWRSQEQAILVGKNTALNDNPKLTTRLVKGCNPTRIVLDRNLAIPKHYNLYNSDAHTIVFNTIKEDSDANIEYIIASQLNDIIHKLYEKKIQSVIVEGGRETLSTFLTENLWDEIRIVKTDVKLLTGLKAPMVNLLPNKIEGFDNNEIHYFYNII